MKTKVGIYLFILAAGVLLGYFTFGSYYKRLAEQKDQRIALGEAAQDSLVTYYNNELGTVVAERQALIAEREVLDEFLKEKQQELYELRKRSKADVGVIAHTETKVDTVVRVVRDTVTNEVIGKVDKMPHYVLNYKQKGDSLSTSLAIYNRQSVELLPSGKLRVINSNPYITVTELNSFYVQPPKKKNHTLRNIGIGVGIGIVGGILISK